MERIVLGLSGGVDSAVSARLLQQNGYWVEGLFLDIGNPSAREDAISTAAFLGIPLKILDISETLEKNVCKPFADAYLRGETPNPCIICNPSVKFRSLCDYADTIGAKFIATGHYARTSGGRLYKGMPANDQSYMLCRVRPEQVARLILPLGGYEKKQVRELADQFGIPVASKPDSMEICFIPENNYIGWLSSRTLLPSPGNIMLNGTVIGKHEGIHRYTVGQRFPGMYNERKVYVGKIDPETNSIEAVLWEDLFKTTVHARNANWMIDRPETPFRGTVRVRHTKWENPACTVTPTGNGFIIECDEPVRAPARGQSAVVYDVDDSVICSGFIC